MIKIYYRICLMFILGFFSTLAQAQLAGWSYKMQVNIVNSSSINRTNYQELILVNTRNFVNAGQMRSDGYDIRFGDKCVGAVTVYPHWIASGMNTDTTRIWVMMPSVPASYTTNIFMYYGNPGASNTSAFSNVFSSGLSSGGNNINLSGASGALQYELLDIEAGDTLFVTQGYVLEIQSRYANINGVIMANRAGEITSSLSSDGKGPGAGIRSSNNTAGSGGGAYGGSGGDGGYDAGDLLGTGGNAHGTASGSDIALGSSGAASDAATGGSGGGAIYLKADEILINGSIWANGGDGGGGKSRNGGGGAGGGIMLSASSLTINGTLSAIGGAGGIGTGTANDDGGGGSGGRVKLLYGTLNGSYKITVAGGAAGLYGTTAPEKGDSGTIYKGAVNSAADSISMVPLKVVLSEPDRRFCKGTPFSLTASTGFTKYTYSLNGTVVASGTNNTITFNKLNSNDSIALEAEFSSCYTALYHVKVIVDTLPEIQIQSDSFICIGDSLKLLASGANSYQWVGGPKTSFWNLKPAATKVYTIIGKDNQGCADTSTKEVSVYTYPVYVPALSAEICEKDSTDLTVVGSNFIIWGNGKTTGTINVKPGSTQYFTYTVFDFAGCELHDSVEVIVNPLPLVYISGANGVCPGSSATLGANGAFFYQWSTGATYFIETVSPTQTTTYSVLGKDDKGCSNTAQKTVVVYTPDAVSINGKNELCSGEVTEIEAMGSVSYLWDNGSKVAKRLVGPSANTTYTVIGTDSNECKDTLDFVLVVNELPVVTVNLPAGMDTVCIGDSKWPLSGGLPSGGTYWGKGVVAAEFTPSAAGLGKHAIWYKYTDGKNCTDSASALMVVDICAGIPDAKEKSIYTIYPNPVSGGFISLQAPQGSYRIFASTGQTVGAIEWHNDGPVAIPDLKPGIYYLRHAEINMPELKLLVVQ